MSPSKSVSSRHTYSTHTYSYKLKQKHNNRRITLGACVSFIIRPLSAVYLLSAIPSRRPLLKHSPKLEHSLP